MKDLKKIKKNKIKNKQTTNNITPYPIRNLMNTKEDEIDLICFLLLENIILKIKLIAFQTIVFLCDLWVQILLINHFYHLTAFL